MGLIDGPVEAAAAGTDAEYGADAECSPSVRDGGDRSGIGALAEGLTGKALGRCETSAETGPRCGMGIVAVGTRTSAAGVGPDATTSSSPPMVASPEDSAAARDAAPSDCGIVQTGTDCTANGDVR